MSEEIKTAGTTGNKVPGTFDSFNSLTLGRIPGLFLEGQWGI
jgi:hypothetical protein